MATGIDLCACNAVLARGVYNHRYLRGQSESLSAVYSFLYKATYEQFQKYFEAGGGISYGDIGFSADMSRSEFEEKQAEFRTAYSSLYQERSSIELLESYGDRNVLEAWMSCKASCDIKDVMLSWVDVNDEHNMTFHLKWDTSHGSLEPTVQGSVIRGAVVLDPSVPEGQVLPVDFTIVQGDTPRSIYREDVNQPVVIDVYVSDGLSITEYVPKHVPVIIDDEDDPPPHFYVALRATWDITGEGPRYVTASGSSLTCEGQSVGYQQSFELIALGGDLSPGSEVQIKYQDQYWRTNSENGLSLGEWNDSATRFKLFYYGGNIVLQGANGHYVCGKVGEFSEGLMATASSLTGENERRTVFALQYLSN